MSPLFKAIREAAPTISVGMLTADLLNLGAEIALLEAAGVKLVHFDVMDGCFCPMTTIGPPVIKAVKTPLIKDVHLMITDPVQKLADYVSAGADIVTVHAEADRHIHRVFQELAAMTNANDPDRGLLGGLALNPGTPVEAVEPLIDQVDLILVLSVNPGRDILIGVDGGITRANVAEVARLGPDLIVTGSAVFDGKARAFCAGALLAAVSAAKAGSG